MARVLAAVVLFALLGGCAVTYEERVERGVSIAQRLRESALSAPRSSDVGFLCWGPGYEEEWAAYHAALLRIHGVVVAIQEGVVVIRETARNRDPDVAHFTFDVFRDQTYKGQVLVVYEDGELFFCTVTNVVLHRQIEVGDSAATTL